MSLYFLLPLLLAALNLAPVHTIHTHHSTPDPKDGDRLKSSNIADEMENDFWIANAQQYLKNKLQQQSQLNNKRAKNVILFLGAGMSMQTITATRAFLGNSAHQLAFDKFPYIGLSKTYCIDRQVPDSGSAATAFLSGVKANYGTIGVNAQVPRSNCTLGQHKEYHTESIAKWAQDAGKWAGLVTTARVTHTTPAGVYAHTADRDWEYDEKVLESGCNPNEAIDTARQLVERPVGKALRVILGGGRRSFLNETMQDVEGEPGRRTDGRNLIDEWLSDKQEMKAQALYATSKQELLKARQDKPDFLLGLFSSSHCPYHGDVVRKGLTASIPSLSEMTKAAIELLSRNDEGYFLFVEGAKIDMAHHDTKARKSLEETGEFSSAVELARTLTSDQDTLIVVTADHAHTMTINGYPKRSHDILGLGYDQSTDGLPYTILSYANGPGYEKTYVGKKGRSDLSKENFKDPDLKYMSTVPLERSTHGGDDVGIYASGPFAHYFSGNYEQSNIPLLMAKAADIGPYAKKQKEKKTTKDKEKNVKNQRI